MRIALGLEYDGSTFCGWQTQLAGCAVQDAVERSLTQIAGHRVATICAGRTDAGVHAWGQVVHFDTMVERPLSAWVRGTTNLMPAAVAVLWVRPVPAEFHARNCARERRYTYLLSNTRMRPALYHGLVGGFHLPLSVERMQKAALALIGEHDFTAFRSAECQAASPVRELRRLSIARHGDYIVFDLAANGYLHHMVRNIVGNLVYVGAGKREPEWLAEVLRARERSLAAPTFAAAGLYLASVSYDAKWQIPETTRAFWPPAAN